MFQHQITSPTKPAIAKNALYPSKNVLMCKSACDLSRALKAIKFFPTLQIVCYLFDFSAVWFVSEQKKKQQQQQQPKVFTIVRALCNIYIQTLESYFYVFSSVLLPFFLFRFFVLVFVFFLLVYRLTFKGERYCFFVASQQQYAATTATREPIYLQQTHENILHSFVFSSFFRVLFICL